MDVLELDSRGRASIGRYFGSDVERVIATTDALGRLILEPAIVVRPVAARIGPALAKKIEDSFGPTDDFVPYVPKSQRGPAGG